MLVNSGLRRLLQPTQLEAVILSALPTPEASFGEEREWNEQCKQNQCRKAKDDNIDGYVPHITKKLLDKFQ